MAHSIWNDLCSPPILTATTEKYSQLVYDSTAQVQESYESLLAALDRRAIALTKLANFESALRDAQAIQQLSPFSALGYIREANIYSQQGKQRQVIDICKKTLNVVDTMDTHYDTLQRAKIDAEQRQSTRIDFIRQLPIAIVTTTLIPMFMENNWLDTHHLCPFLYVSNLWRNRIIQCFNGLRIKIKNEHDNHQIAQAALFAPHVKTLAVRNYSHGTWLGDLLMEKNFCSLEQLSIDFFRSDQGDHFLASLRSIRNTLIKFKIGLEYGPLLHLSKIILTCPNLISVDIRFAMDANLSMLSRTTWPALTTLSLTLTRTPITCDQIIGIWKRFPSLKSLKLGPCTDASSAFIVPDYCPSLKSLDVYTHCYGLILTYSDEGNSNQTPGITKLTGRREDTLGKQQPFKDTSSIIKRYHSTLEYLECDIDTRQDTENIEHLQYPRLKKLGLHLAGWEIPRNAPMLEEIMLEKSIINIYPQVLDAIPPRLKKVDLDLRASYLADDRPSIIRYLDRLAEHPQLTEIGLRCNSRDRAIAGVLDAICRHHRLERLTMTFTMTWDDIQMEKFFIALVNGCPRLSSLRIQCQNAPSTHSINALKGLEHLQELAFPLYKLEFKHGLWEAIKHFLSWCVSRYTLPI